MNFEIVVLAFEGCGATGTPAAEIRFVRFAGCQEVAWQYKEMDLMFETDIVKVELPKAREIAASYFLRGFERIAGSDWLDMP